VKDGCQDLVGEGEPGRAAALDVTVEGQQIGEIAQLLPEGKPVLPTAHQRLRHSFPQCSSQIRNPLCARPDSMWSTLTTIGRRGCA
jgi:hypothetical protein